MFIASAEEILSYDFLYFTGLLPFFRINSFHVLSIPWMTRDYVQHRLGQRNEHPFFSVNYWMQNVYIGFIPILNRVNGGFLRHLEKRGILICFWTLNSDDEVESVVKQPGVRGIMSDRPAAIKKLLQL